MSLLLLLARRCTRAIAASKSTKTARVRPGTAAAATHVGISLVTATNGRRA